MLKNVIDYFYYFFEIIFVNFSFIAKFYVGFHEPYIKKEIEILELSKSDKILHIGCGSIPYTSIIIHKIIGSNVVGIDSDPKMVRSGNNFLKRLDFLEGISIEIGLGEDYNVSDFDVIIISLGVLKQFLILENIVKSMNEKSKIILRRKNLKDDDKIKNLLDDFSIKKIDTLTTKSFLLLKNKRK